MLAELPHVDEEEPLLHASSSGAAFVVLQWVRSCEYFPNGWLADKQKGNKKKSNLI